MRSKPTPLCAGPSYPDTTVCPTGLVLNVDPLLMSVTSLK